MGAENTSVNHEELINKSLDEIESLVKGMETAEEEQISKAVPQEDATPDEVSQDTPPPTEDGQEDQQPTDEGAGDDADVDTDTESEENEQEDDEVEKSLEDTMKGNEGVRKALEVSEFLDELVKGISTVIGNQGATLSKSISSNEQSQALLAKSFKGIVDSQKAVLTVTSNLQKSIHALTERLEAVESQPLVRKSVPNAKAIEKSFPASTGAQNSGNTASNTLSKGVAVQRLSEEVMKGNSSLMNDVLALEGSGNFNSLSAEAKTFLGLTQ